MEVLSTETVTVANSMATEFAASTEVPGSFKRTASVFAYKSNRKIFFRTHAMT